jgi:hypothetical protein
MDHFKDIVQSPFNNNSVISSVAKDLYELLEANNKACVQLNFLSVDLKKAINRFETKTDLIMHSYNSNDEKSSHREQYQSYGVVKESNKNNSTVTPNKDHKSNYSRSSIEDLNTKRLNINPEMRYDQSKANYLKNAKSASKSSRIEDDVALSRQDLSPDKVESYASNLRSKKNIVEETTGSSSSSSPDDRIVQLRNHRHESDYYLGQSKSNTRGSNSRLSKLGMDLQNLAMKLDAFDNPHR